MLGKINHASDVKDTTNMETINHYIGNQITEELETLIKELHSTIPQLNYIGIDDIKKFLELFIKIEFQGGDPSTDFEMVKYIIEEAEWQNLFKIVPFARS